MPPKAKRRVPIVAAGELKPVPEPLRQWADEEADKNGDGHPLYKIHRPEGAVSRVFCLVLLTDCCTAGCRLGV